MFYLANYLLITHVVPYYYNPNIHNFGNIGLGGKIHANLSPFATKMIDMVRYDNKDIRKELMSEYKDNTILDLCCGTGFSTYDNAIGIDTSYEMLDIAKKLKTNKNKNKKFYYGNAENYIPECDIDVVSCMFAFHEMPLFAQLNVIHNALKIANKEIVIVDISPNYTPSQIMLSGEPYLNNYLNNINDILYEFDETILIPNHVHIWKKKIN